MVNDFEIKTFGVGFIETNMYLVIENRLGLVIDPGFIESEANRIIKEIKKGVDEIPMVLLTHCHFDHISGCGILKKEFKCKIYCHKLDEEKLIDPHMSGAHFFVSLGFSLKPDGYLSDNQELRFSNLNLKIIHTPGHTKGGVAILLEDKYLFSGDTIFKDSIGRTDLYDGDYDTEIDSITKKILVLPKETIILPGHGPQTTVKDEMKNFIMSF